MKKDYNRAICNECPIKEKCEEYRNKNWCVECDASLQCLIKGKQIRPSACMEMYTWKTQYRKCLLVNSLYTNETVLNNLMRTKLGLYVCPRCLNSSLSARTYNVLGSINRRIMRCYLHCAVCDVRSCEYTLGARNV